MVAISKLMEMVQEEASNLIGNVYGTHGKERSSWNQLIFPFLSLASSAVFGIFPF